MIKVFRKYGLSDLFALKAVLIDKYIYILCIITIYYSTLYYYYYSQSCEFN